MSDEHNEMTADEKDALKKLLDIHAAKATQHFTDLAAEWGLGGLHHQLEELVNGLAEADRPKPAVILIDALAGYLDAFGPKGVVGTSDTYRDHA